MLHSLHLHHESRCASVSRIEVEVTRPAAGRLRLRYIVAGNVSGLVLPEQEMPLRTDELWKHTCFEAFIRPADGDAYVEVNLAPSTRWAAYRFDRYRAGMADADVDAPGFAVLTAPDRFELAATVNLARLPNLPASDWRLGLTAVIEEVSGAKSYWALAHPAGKPDFHKVDGFVLNLPAAERT